MKSRGELYYEARIAFGTGALLPILALPAYALLYRFIGYDDAVRIILKGFEVVLPLSATLAAAHLMTVEREAGFDELRSTYPEHPWRLPLLRTAGALGLTALAAALGAAGFRLAAGTYPLGETLLPAVAPTLWLLALSLLAGNLTGSYWAAAGVTMGYWLYEIFTRANPGLLFLFAGTWAPLDEGYPYALNRWLLAGLGVAALWANGALSARRRRGTLRG